MGGDSGQKSSWLKELKEAKKPYQLRPGTAGTTRKRSVTREGLSESINSPVFSPKPRSMTKTRTLTSPNLSIQRGHSLPKDRTSVISPKPTVSIPASSRSNESSSSSSQLTDSQDGPKLVEVKVHKYNKGERVQTQDQKENSL